jgi:rSAM/selenodomain-associated transferase 1
MKRVVVYGRPPIPGAAKTRLAAGIGQGAAARVYGELLRHTLQVALSVDPGAVLSLATRVPDAWLPEPEIRTEIQAEGDLGTRLTESFRRRFCEGCTEVLIIGSDCAELKAAHLKDAWTRLESENVVFGPATDGGFWLVGQRPPARDLFSGIPWSTAAAMEAARQRMRELGVSWSELGILADVDTVEDLERFLVLEGEDPVFVDRLRASARNDGKAWRTGE